MAARLPGRFNHDRFKRGKTDEYETPKALFYLLDHFYHFTLDACANRHNHLVPNYLTKERDALLWKWHGRAWCNPPYSQVAPFVHKGFCESLDGALVVMLLPAYIDAPWYHDLCEPFAYCKPLRGHIGFGTPGGKQKSGPAFFPNLIAVFPRDRAIIF